MRNKEKSRSILYLTVILAILTGVIVIPFVGIGKAHQGSAKKIPFSFDLAGGGSISNEAVGENPADERRNDTVYKIQKRVQGLNTESAVYREGSNRINVNILGVSDDNEIPAKLRKAGFIQFQDEAGNLVIDGSHIQTARAGTIQNKQGYKEYIVELTLNDEGTKKFAAATKKNIGKQFAIIYDGEVLQSPKVQSAITDGKVQISGQQSYEEADKLASTIRIGAHPLELKELPSSVVGAKLGAEAVLDSTVVANMPLFHINFIKM